MGTSAEQCLPACLHHAHSHSPRAPTPAAIVHRLATGREPVLTGSVVTVLYIVARLAGLFSLLGLAYTGVLALFTVPKVRGRWWEGGREAVAAVLAGQSSLLPLFWASSCKRAVGSVPEARGLCTCRPPSMCRVSSPSQSILLTPPSLPLPPSRCTS